MKKIKLKDFEFGGEKLVIIGGPCAIERRDIVLKTAEKLKEITTKLNLPFVFKASYDKANRTSITSFRGLGMDEGLKILKEVKDQFDLPIITDIHETHHAKPVAEVADILQIPAFLSRQTDILVEAAKTGKIINIKKGQFLSVEQLILSAKKVENSGNNQVLLTERGNSFGYQNLVVDMRNIFRLKELGYPVVFDATHSVQLPGGGDDCSSGERQFVEPLSNAALASGAGCLFYEIHPNPEQALCDGANMIALDNIEKILSKNKSIFEVVNQQY